MRVNTQARLAELKRKVDACLEAGALATGARLVLTPTRAYADHVPNRVLGRAYRRWFNALDPPHRVPENEALAEITGRTAASTDQGDVSYALPSLHPGFSIAPGPGGQGPHNPGFAKAAGTRDAFARCLRVAKALAGVAVDVLTEDGLLDEVKEEWRREMKSKQ